MIKSSNLRSTNQWSKRVRGGGSLPALNVGKVDGGQPAKTLDEEEDGVGQLARGLGDDVIDVVDPQDGSPA